MTKTKYNLKLREIQRHIQGNKDKNDYKNKPLSSRNIFEVLKENSVNLEFSIQKKYPLKMKVKIFSHINKS